MARPTSIEFKDVQKACEDALAADEPITFANVYERMGRKGGAAVVQRMIAQFRSERGVAADGRVRDYEAPEDFVEHIARPFFDRCWKRAVAFNEEFHLGKLEEAKREYSALEARLEDAKSQTQAANTLVTILQADLNATSTDRSRLQDQVTQLQSGLADTARARDQFASRCSELEKAVEQLNNTLREELEKGARLLAKTKDECTAQLATERERGDGERRMLMEQTDRLRQEASAQVAELKRNLAAREKMEGEHRVRAEKATQELKEAQGRLRELEVALAASRDRADRAQARADELQAASSRSAAAIAAAESRAKATQERFEDERRRSDALQARVEEMGGELESLRAKMLYAEPGKNEQEESGGKQSGIKKRKAVTRDA